VSYARPARFVARLNLNARRRLDAWASLSGAGKEGVLEFPQTRHRGAHEAISFGIDLANFAGCGSWVKGEAKAR
jgi:hypothetical protein